MTIFKDYLFPLKCVVCQQGIEWQDAGLCSICLQKLKDEELLVERCQICQTELKEGQCFFCSERYVFFEQNIICFTYTSTVKRIISAYKRSNVTVLATLLGKELTEKIKKSKIEFDFVTYVPTTRRKLSERGYNPTELLAKEVACNFNKPIKSVLIEKNRHSSQKENDREQRFLNALNRFSVKKKSPVQKQRVLVIDDVFTTGATLNEISRILKNAGADAVFTAVIGLVK